MEGGVVELKEKEVAETFAGKFAKKTDIVKTEIGKKGISPEEIKKEEKGGMEK